MYGRTKLLVGRMRGRVAHLLAPSGQVLYSQEGEDAMLLRLFGEAASSNLFYVDVGAHHPYRFSNTYAFYLRGSRGMNIEARPGAMADFQLARPRDINIEAAVAATAGHMTYYAFTQPALNTFSETLARHHESTGRRIQSRQNVEVHRLETLLDRWLPTGQTIDFMSIDVEGMELEVLRSNDWNKYRPSVLLVEHLGPPQSDRSFRGRPRLRECLDSEAAGVMRSFGYSPYFRTISTTFFVDDAAAARAKVHQHPAT